MSDDEQDMRLDRRHGELLAKLRMLSEAIERQSYPGLGWPARRRRRRRVAIGVALGAAAAAAIVILAIAPHQPPASPAPPRPISPAPPALRFVLVMPTLSLDVPTDIGLPSAGDVKLEAVGVSIPSTSEITPAVTIDFDVPTFSALTLK